MFKIKSHIHIIPHQLKPLSDFSTVLFPSKYTMHLDSANFRHQYDQKAQMAHDPPSLSFPKGPVTGAQPIQTRKVPDKTTSIGTSLGENPNSWMMKKMDENWGYPHDLFETSISKFHNTAID